MFHFFYAEKVNQKLLQKNKALKLETIQTPKKSLQIRNMSGNKYFWKRDVWVSHKVFLKVLSMN